VSSTFASSAVGPGAEPLAETRAFSAIEEAVGSVVLCPPLVLRLSVGCLAAGGHLLVEDHPGLGKTTLAKALAKAVGLDFRRVQCTADLLPADITGATVIAGDGGTPVFRPGPVFTNVLMADELNRASPRAQSALLEAMEERQVSVDGHTHVLPHPFFVLATQNPYDAAGTSPLPHGQRDRFLVRVSLGYPPRQQMEALLEGTDPSERVRVLKPAVSPEAFGSLSAAVARVHVAVSVRGYVLDLVEAVDRHPDVAVGPSPRAARALVQAGCALAVASGRSYLSPTDVQETAAAVLAHRVLLHPTADLSVEGAERLVEEIVDSVPVPLRDHP
jgi:MoxR-like ATPase